MPSSQKSGYLASDPPPPPLIESHEISMWDGTECWNLIMLIQGGRQGVPAQNLETFCKHFGTGAELTSIK